MMLPRPDMDSSNSTRSRTGLLWILLLITVSGCDNLAVKEDVSSLDAMLVNHQGEDVSFPRDFSGHVTLVGYIYTICPDICPLTTQRMNQVALSLDPSEAEQIRVAGITMDPDRDTPDMLARYAESYRLASPVWSLLTGERSHVMGLLDQLEITVRRTPTRFTSSGEMIYFLDHTDRVSLIDEQGRIRRHYLGSELDVEQVVRDIRTLLQS